jgi:hypothetical protein
LAERFGCGDEESSLRYILRVERVVTSVVREYRARKEGYAEYARVFGGRQTIQERRRKIQTVTRS